MWPRHRRLGPLPAAPIAIGALAVMVAGLAAWNLDLQRRMKAQDLALAQQRQFLSAVVAGGSVSALAGTEAAPGASGNLMQDPNANRAFLLLTNLPSLPTDREFQVWRIKGGKPVGVGAFSPADVAQQLVAAAADFAGADAIGISIEPQGGSTAPTGPIVLLGTF